jgi:hypothetical protein
MVFMIVKPSADGFGLQEWQRISKGSVVNWGGQGGDAGHVCWFVEIVDGWNWQA